jgi:UDP-glucose 4-epimerase
MGKVILTGTTGFIGSNFLEYIHHQGYHSKNDVVLLSYKHIPGYQTVDRNASSWRSDLQNLLNGEIAETVYHLGSFTPKSGDDSNNLNGSNSNIDFTQDLIDTIRPPKCFVFTSTLDVYDFKEVVDENTLPNPSSLYAWSKLYCEKMLSVWANSNKVNLQVLRVGHVYGEGEDAYKKLIPVTIEACLNAKNPKLFTSGSELRSFLYIQDLCKMIYQSSLFECGVGVVNLVGNEPKSVKDVVDTIVQQVNSSLSCELAGGTTGVSTRFSNIKMIELFGNKYTPFSIGIRNEINYFKSKRLAPRRNIYIDLDGTLIDARKRLYQLFVDLSGSAISFNDYWEYKRAQRSNDYLLKQFENFSLEKIEMFKSIWLDKIELKEYLSFDELFPEIKEILSMLSASNNLVLITGRQSYENLIWQLEKFEIDGYFKGVLNTANKISKEEMIKQYTNVFHPDDIIIGDTGIEVIAGRSLGIKSVAVLTGFRNREALEKYAPDFIFTDIKQFAEFFKTNA